VLLSCHGFRLFLDRLLGVVYRWRSKHCTKAGPQVLGAWSLSLDGNLDPLIEVERVGLVYARSINETRILGYPAVIY
jgi:hypothetical protein